MENLKRVILIITKLITSGETVFKDGFQFGDVFVFIPELAQIPDIVQNKQALADELKALDAASIKDLEAYIQGALVLENKNIEEIIEAAIGVLVSVFNLISKIKGPKAV